MSGSETDNEDVSDALAFEYVAGTLRGEDRSRFEHSLVSDEKMMSRVRFWEERLHELDAHTTPRDLRPGSWTDLSARINTGSKPAAAQNAGKLQWLWQWLLPGALSLALLVVLLLPAKPLQSPNADYVAVLTNTDGHASLTALTTSTSQTMWLQWEDLEISSGRSAQLWSISRSDGQIRSIAVFDTLGAEQLPLDEAAWRLVKDAEFLILTEEEAGGSPLDEPSDVLLAKGVCVRFQRSNTI